MKIIVFVIITVLHGQQDGNKHLSVTGLFNICHNMDMLCVVYELVMCTAPFMVQNLYTPAT